ncbi:sortase-associated OmpA-like protein PdsO [Planctobacterium marinum]|uniref:OmpA-like domain-containing protein n=1 Tax=Planctobacterium marinum TaxID=1631968 RepID=A0AA48HFC9_9ALTE|nr:hypothetical protein MACH26_14540 [Planctobacterium marinum]
MTFKTLNKTLIAISLCASFATMAESDQEQHEVSTQEEEKHVLIGLGSGAAIGASVAGPVGGIIGGIMGIFIGDDINNQNRADNLQVKLVQSETELLALQQEYQQTLTAFNQLKAQQSNIQVAALERETAPIELSELLDSKANIQFKTASWQLEQHYVEQLDKVAEQLQRDPKLVVQLFGYADRRGDEEYNLTLSEKRADQVKRYLLSRGVQAVQIETAGYGEAQPVAVKQTWENDFFDRRVVVRLTSEDAVMTAKQ